MVGVERSWSRIESWLERHAPTIRRDLRPGVSAAYLHWVEDQIGRSLPADVAASYAIHDGAAGNGLIAFWDFLPVAGVVRAWQALKKLADGGHFNDNRGKPDGPVRPVWWDEGWVPFTSGLEGNHDCFDLAPTRGGRPGQVIAWVHDDDPRKRIAPTFGRWLAGFAADLAAERYVLSKRGRLIRDGEPRPGWGHVYKADDPDADV